MDFSKEQLQKISEFIQNCNNLEFRENTEKKYIDNPEALSILEIYALEEVLRVGNKNIYNNFLEAMKESSIKECVEQLDQFLNFYNENESFKNYKLQQYAENPETLSKLEVYVLEKIIKVKIVAEKIEDQSVEDSTNELEYDELNPIKFAHEIEIKETLTNLLIGEFIFNILNLPQMAQIKARQKKPGMIANIDKPIIIKTVHDTIINELQGIPQAVNQMYAQVKLNLLLGKGEDAFKEFSKFNTNISAREVLEYEDKKAKRKKYN